MSGRARVATRTSAGLVLLALLMACGGSSSDGPSTPTPTPTPTPPPGGAFDYNGITHVSWWHDQYGYTGATASRSALAATANTEASGSKGAPATSP